MQGVHRFEPRGARRNDVKPLAPLPGELVADHPRFGGRVVDQDDGDFAVGRHVDLDVTQDAELRAAVTQGALSDDRADSDVVP